MRKLFLTCALVLLSASAQARAVWTPGQANAWYAKQKWLVGSNYIPADAINQLEMWQEASFDPAQIDKELGWAQAMGMTTMRVFLHDALWSQDAPGLKKRIAIFLDIAARHRIKTLFVLFDSCWDPNPKLGAQHPPIPGVHNSGWVQGPGAKALADPSQYPRLESYVKDIVGSFAEDDRILGWDVWNEPDNTGGGAYDDKDPARVEHVAYLLPRVFDWARSENPSQPLTSGIWDNDHWEDSGRLNAVEKTQLTQSDVISFHDYSWPETFEMRAKSLEGVWPADPLHRIYGAGRRLDHRYRAAHRQAPQYRHDQLGIRGRQDPDRSCLGIAGSGPTPSSPPTIWFHDLLHPDGTPYRAREIAIIQSLSAAPKGVVPPLGN